MTCELEDDDSIERTKEALKTMKWTIYNNWCQSMVNFMSWLYPQKIKIGKIPTLVAKNKNN
jgi:hypothetical protein